MTSRTEGICLGLCLACALILVLNVFPTTAGWFSAFRLGRAPADSPLERPGHISASGFEAESIFLPGADGKEVIIRNADGLPVMTVGSATFLGWAPHEDLALLRHNGDHTGLRLLDLRNYNGSSASCHLTPVFATGLQATAGFAPAGKHIDITPRDGNAEAIPLHRLLQRAPLYSAGPLDPDD